MRATQWIRTLPGVEVGAVNFHSSVESRTTLGPRESVQPRYASVSLMTDCSMIHESAGGATIWRFGSRVGNWGDCASNGYCWACIPTTGLVQHLTGKGRGEGGRQEQSQLVRREGLVGCKLPLESKSNATACASDKVPDCVDPEEQCSQYLAGWAVQ